MAPSNIPQYTKDEKVLCFHHELLYEAKVLDLKHTIEGDKKSPYQYRVHYKGWKSTWDDWVPQDRIRKNNEDNKILAANLKTEMERVQKPKAAAASAKKKAAGSDLSSTRGSEERHATPVTGRGQKRGRDYEIEKVRGRSLVTPKSRMENSPTPGSDEAASAHKEDDTAESRPRKRPRRNLPVSTVPTTAPNIASKFLINVSSLHPPSRKHLARSAHIHGNLGSQTSNMPLLPYTIPYDHLDQAEEDAGFPPLGYIYPGISGQRSPEDEGRNAVDAHRGGSLSPKISASCLETAPSPRRAKSLAPVVSIPPPVQVAPVVAQAPTDMPKLTFIAPTKVKKDKYRCPAGLDAELWLEAPPNLALLSPPVPPPRTTLEGIQLRKKKEQQKQKKKSKKYAYVTAGIPLDDTPEELEPYEETFNLRPAVRIHVPDHLKALLVDDWENVTKNLSLVPLPSEHPVNEILNTYFEEEKHKRRLGSAEADLLEEVVAGCKDYFEKCIGRILLYRFERQQYAEVRKLWEEGRGEWEGKNAGDVYGAEHLCRLFVSLPELIAQTNMDAQSVNKLREEIQKLTSWLGKNSNRFFTAEYEIASNDYVENNRGV